MIPYELREMVDGTVTRSLDCISKQIKELSDKINALDKCKGYHELLDKDCNHEWVELYGFPFALQCSKCKRLSDKRATIYKCKGRNLSDYVGYYESPDKIAR